MTQDPERQSAKAWPPFIRHGVGILVVTAIAFIGWRAFHKIANNRDGTMSSQMFIAGNRVKSIVTRKRAGWQILHRRYHRRELPA